MTSNECRKRSAAKCSLCSPHAGRTISEQRQSTASGANWPFRPEREPPAVKLNRRKHQHSHGDCRESAANATDDRARQASGCCRLALSLNRRSASALHTVQRFTREYPHGDRDGNEVSIRVAPGRAAIDIHRLWDWLITSTNNVAQRKAERPRQASEASRPEGPSQCES
jgi:hypothetical protein